MKKKKKEKKKEKRAEWRKLLVLGLEGGSSIRWIY